MNQLHIVKAGEGMDIHEVATFTNLADAVAFRDQYNMIECRETDKAWLAEITHEPADARKFFRRFEIEQQVMRLDRQIEDLSTLAEPDKDDQDELDRITRLRDWLLETL